MAAGDLRVVQAPGGVRQHEVASGATAINPGEPIKRSPSYTTGASDVNTVVVAVDGDPVIGTDEFIGIAQNSGSHTSSAAGVVSVIELIPFVSRIRGKAATSTNVDTASELTNILYDLVTFDLSSSTYTIDENDSADNAGLRIEDGDETKQTLDVSVDGRAMRSDVTV